jgi:hypothetical protein
MEQVVRPLSNEAENKRIEKETERLGRKNADCLQLLIRLYSSGLSLEQRELVHSGERRK